MKELSIEEKAKAYDEAIKRAKELLEIGLKDTKDKRIVLSFFPELAESEDERIRKVLVELVKCNERCGYFIINNITTSAMLAWLEKQGEQKPAEWSKEDEARFESCIKVLQTSNGYDTINVKWLKSLKDRVQPQQQWSEEDEDMCYKTTAVINRLCADGKEYVWSISTLEKLFYWLKSIRPQSTWRPSATDIMVLEGVIDGGVNPVNYHATLHVVLDQLKKLRGE